MSKEIALDLRRYTPETLHSLVEDTASLSIEASSNENLPRVNPHFYIKKGDEYVIAPGKDKRDVSHMFASGFAATEAALEIRRMLLEDRGEFAYVWISPSGDYPESRVEVGVKQTKKSRKIEYLKCYGISTTLSKEKCLAIGQLLVSLSPKEYPMPQSPEDLVALAIKIEIPKDQGAFEYLSKLIDLPEKNRWQSILSTLADKNKAKARLAAAFITAHIRENPDRIYINPIGKGAYIEIAMAQAGYGMNPEKFGCGSSNTDSVEFGRITIFFNFEDQYGSLQFTCPKCGAINTRSAGELLSNCQRCGGNVRC